MLALQGDFAEHIGLLQSLEVEGTEVRLARDLDKVEKLIIPGGESTTILNLMRAFDLEDPIKHLIKDGMPTWGTCAGMIVLAQEISDGFPDPLRVIDIRVKRNAYGGQRESFESDIDITPLEGRENTFRGVFIRAPYIETVGSEVRPLAYLNSNNVVAAQEGRVMVTSFHPELTQDTRFHEYFLNQL